MIHTLKYKSVAAIGPLLGQLLYLHAYYPDVDMVTAVPLTPAKERIRGFNQAAEIAKGFALFAQVPYQPLLLRSSSSLQNQATLKSRTARTRNMDQNHFQVKNTFPLPQRVMIIDDVFTTGTTLSACAQVLKSNGVKHVHGLVVAHGK